MQEKNERNINELDLLNGNQDILKIAIAGMRRRMLVCLQRNEGHTEGNEN